MLYSPNDTDESVLIINKAMYRRHLKGNFLINFSSSYFFWRIVNRVRIDGADTYWITFVTHNVMSSARIEIEISVTLY